MRTKKADSSAENKRLNLGRMSQSTKAVALVAALVCAVVLWIYAIGYDSTIFERTFNGIEVTLTGEKELSEKLGLTLASGQTLSSITVVASGKRSELNELDNADFSAVVDVSSVAASGNTTLPIVVYSPNGIEVTSQSSTTVNLFIDEFTQKNYLLSVSVDTGTGYIMSEGVVSIDAVANPLSVSVSGPKSALDAIEGAYVKFNLDGVVLNDSIYGYGGIELRDADGSVTDNPYVVLSEETAYVAVTVRRRKTLPVVYAFTGGVLDTESASVVLSAQSIIVEGSRDSLAGIDSIVLNIDESTINGSESFVFQVSPLLPEGVENVSGISRITADVAVPSMAARKYTVQKGNIRFVNLPEGQTAEVQNDLVITVMGAREAVDAIDRKAISATVDFDSLTVNDDGTYSARPSVYLGDGAEGIYVLNTGYEVVFSVSIPQE